MKLINVYLLLTLFLTVAANAQNNSGGEGTTEVLKFQDQLVEGGVAQPNLFYLLQKRNFNYKRLIKLRENFLPEMKRSSEDISVEKNIGTEDGEGAL